MFSENPNRIAKYFPELTPKPARRTTADKLLAGAWGCKIEMIRFPSDDGDSECSCEVELKTTVEGDPADVLAALLAQFREGGEGTVNNG